MHTFCFPTSLRYLFTICNGCGMPAENAYPPGHLVPSNYRGLHILCLLRLVFPDVHQFYDLDTELDLYWITRSFHRIFATGVACQQGALTLPDTWFRPPFRDLLMLQFLNPDSSNLLCLKANMKSYIQLETAAIFFSCEPIFKTGYWLGVWYGWFHLHGLTRAVRSENRE